MRVRLHGTWPYSIPTKGQESILQTEFGLFSVSDWLCDLERDAVLLWANITFVVVLAASHYAGWLGRVNISLRLSPALTLSISATGPLEERQIAYVCREALKVLGS